MNVTYFEHTYPSLLSYITLYHPSEQPVPEYLVLSATIIGVLELSEYRASYSVPAPFLILTCVALIIAS
jgi:hypothetical protein